MGGLFSPRHVTETNEPPPWTDCTWASGLMLANKASRGQYPSTRAEREALRAASGDHIGGSSLYNLRDGIKARYGWLLDLDFPAFNTLLQRLERGDGAAVQGLYNHLPSHFQRWDREFAQKPNPAHQTYVQGHDRGGNFHKDRNGNLVDIFWDDPLGRSPAGTPIANQYRGEWMPVSVLLDFARSLTHNAASLNVATVRNGEHHG